MAKSGGKRTLIYAQKPGGDLPTADFGEASISDVGGLARTCRGSANAGRAITLPLFRKASTLAFGAIPARSSGVFGRDYASENSCHTDLLNRSTERFALLDSRHDQSRLSRLFRLTTD